MYPLALLLEMMFGPIRIIKLYLKYVRDLYKYRFSGTGGKALFF